MTKAEIVARVAHEIKISKAAAGKALLLVTDFIAESVRKGQKVTFVGFGTFSVVQRKARKGRNLGRARRSGSPRGRYSSSPQGGPQGSGRRKGTQESRTKKSACCESQKEVGTTGRARKGPPLIYDCPFGSRCRAEPPRVVAWIACRCVIFAGRSCSVPAVLLAVSRDFVCIPRVRSRAVGEPGDHREGYPSAPFGIGKLYSFHMHGYRVGHWAVYLRAIRSFCRLPRGIWRRRNWRVRLHVALLHAAREKGCNRKGGIQLKRIR
ncbi:MAG: DNA-binding protein HU-beta [Syntrophorhabdus sp. PtaB.Bin184]|nr:MAG: DNA-binding protein HU-beta [Syntrophorhabdus sp. PtaB.Bin184]